MAVFAANFQRMCRKLAGSLCCHTVPAVAPTVWVLSHKYPSDHGQKSVCSSYTRSTLRCSARIERTPHPAPTALQHMCVDHRRSDVLMPQEFLYCPNVVTIL